MLQDIPSSCILRVYLLGPLEVLKRGVDGDWKPIEKKQWRDSKAARRVFKRLLVQPGRRLSRSRLQDEIWSNLDLELADKYLYTTISIIHGVIGKGLVTTWEASYELAGQAEIWTDMDACERLLKSAEDQGYTSIQALPHLEQALTYLERGECLEREDGAWCYGFRARAEGMLKQCRLWLAEAYETQGKFWQAGEQYRMLCQSVPFDENALRAWMALLTRQGKRQEALKCYQDIKDVAETQGFSLSSEAEQIATSLSGGPDQTLLVPPHIVQNSIESDETTTMDIFRRRLLEASMHVAKVAPLLPMIDLFDNEVLERFSQALTKPLHLDEATFRYLEICTEQFWYNRQSAVFSSRDLYRPVKAHLQKMIALLEGSLLSTERIRLCSLLSQTAQLLGELLLDMGYYAQGKAFHQAALAAAQEAGDQFLTAVSWGRISLACIYSKSHDDALTFIQTARSLGIKHSTPMIQGWLAAIEAEIQAHLSQADLCRQALEHAECFDQHLSSSLEGYLVRFDHSLLGGYQGVCFRVLARPEQKQSPFFLQKAQDSLREALASLDHRFLQRRPTLLTDLAVVSIYQQDVEEACTLISQAATLATQMHLHKVIQRLIALREPLKPWKDCVPVKTLDAQLAFLSSQGNRQC